MTRILAIEGTDIREAVPDCQNCRLHTTFDGAHFCALLDEELDGGMIEQHHLWSEGQYIDPRCPLPEAKQ